MLHKSVQSYKQKLLQAKQKKISKELSWTVVMLNDIKTTMYVCHFWKPCPYISLCLMFFPLSTFLTTATSLFLWWEKIKTRPLSRFIWLSHDHTHSFQLRKKNRGSRQHVKKEKKKPKTWTLSRNASKKQTCLFQQGNCSVSILLLQLILIRVYLLWQKQ